MKINMNPNITKFQSTKQFHAEKEKNQTQEAIDETAKRIEDSKDRIKLSEQLIGK